MENNNIKDFINKALLYFDKQQQNMYINADIQFLPNNKILLELNNYPKLETNYEVLGLFDNNTNVWLWSWLIPYFNVELVKLSRELLNYGLKLDPSTNIDLHYYLKIQFLNSRITINNDIELDIHLAIISYLMKNKYSFIYPFKHYYNDEKTKYQTIYYIIK